MMPADEKPITTTLAMTNYPSLSNQDITEKGTEVAIHIKFDV